MVDAKADNNGYIWYECEYCQKRYAFHGSAKKCEQAHIDAEDRFYGQWKDKQLIAESLNEASKPGQQKL